MVDLIENDLSFCSGPSEHSSVVELVVWREAELVGDTAPNGFSVCDCLSVCDNESQMSAIISLACVSAIWSERGNK